MKFRYPIFIRISFFDSSASESLLLVLASHELKVARIVKPKPTASRQLPMDVDTKQEVETKQEKGTTQEVATEAVGTKQEVETKQEQGATQEVAIEKVELPREDVEKGDGGLVAELFGKDEADATAQSTATKLRESLEVLDFVFSFFAYCFLFVRLFVCLFV
jgi:hypothetical protein